jgi:hypothetical protein
MMVLGEHIRLNYAQVDAPAAVSTTQRQMCSHVSRPLQPKSVTLARQPQPCHEQLPRHLSCKLLELWLPVLLLIASS